MDGERSLISPSSHDSIYISQTFPSTFIFIIDNCPKAKTLGRVIIYQKILDYLTDCAIKILNFNDIDGKVLKNKLPFLTIIQIPKMLKILNGTKTRASYEKSCEYDE